MDNQFIKNEPTLSLGSLPLCVDLDGTLVKTDTLLECLAAGAHKWSVVRRVLGWLLHGKARFKAQLAAHIDFKPDLLPYNNVLLQYLQDQKSYGRRLILVTAANSRIAEGVNQHLGIFDETIASDNSRNLRGKEKAKLLTDRFGHKKFSYAGNDRTDLHVWKCAYSGVLVNASRKTAKKAENTTIIEKCFNRKTHELRALFRALRPHQWGKNLLIFVPIITSKAFGDINALLNALMVFTAFCSTASAIYIINDLYDLEADRKHPNKCKRPLASGDLSIGKSFMIVPILLFIGLAFSVATGIPQITLLLACYGATSIIYSIKLKKLPLVDVFTLSALYATRLFSGGEATGYRVSFWLLTFSGFLFLSLAILKRTTELKTIQDREGHEVSRRGYSTEDLLVMQSFGIASSFVSSLVIALYIQSFTAGNLYGQPQILWLMVPLMLFWQCRLWLSTTRGYMHDDPIVYAVKDWVSWLVGLMAIIILFMASIKA
jgi:4-hydroxybenzoate polyprenyltransferase/phosphoserine phosphatase